MAMSLPCCVLLCRLRLRQFPMLSGRCFPLLIMSCVGCFLIDLICSIQSDSRNGTRSLQVSNRHHERRNARYCTFQHQAPHGWRRVHRTREQTARTSAQRVGKRLQSISLRQSSSSSAVWRETAARELFEGPSVDSLRSETGVPLPSVPIMPRRRDRTRVQEPAASCLRS